MWYFMEIINYLLGPPWLVRWFFAIFMFSVIILIKKSDHTSTSTLTQNDLNRDYFILFCFILLNNYFKQVLLLLLLLVCLIVLRFRYNIYEHRYWVFDTVSFVLLVVFNSIIILLLFLNTNYDLIIQLIYVQ